MEGLHIKWVQHKRERDTRQIKGRWDFTREKRAEDGNKENQKEETKCPVKYYARIQLHTPHIRTIHIIQQCRYYLHNKSITP